jgi:hypothetical protein
VCVKFSQSQSIVKTDTTSENACENKADRHVAYARYFVIGLGAAAVCTLAGSAIALVRGELESFAAEWRSLQGPFLIGLGTWLVLISTSGALTDLATKLAKNADSPSIKPVGRVLRVLCVCTVGVAGTASLVWMGFNAKGPLLIFMWVTCAAVCFAAGFVTLHTIDLLLVVHGLRTAGIKTFLYAPARTPELRELINYFTSFTLILSIAYSFAFAGTIYGHWTGDRAYIEAVQLFWPLVYVPICSAALIYPHLVMHSLVREAKESSLVSYQKEIDELMLDYKGLNNEGVSKINSLAQLFERISATPDYVVDVGIAVRTCLPLAFNVGILLAKPLLGQS